ncbi:MAG: caspase family protein [Vannielia sp.]|uniref:caspase family protein n=1 Tax=Vannielia sp. TaxID=2813045 RepID=UPI003B8BA97C
MKLKALLLAGVAAMAALPALARDNHALLIGASTYPALEERFWLKGPANDIDLVQTYLLTNESIPFEAAHVTVLADGIEGKQAPTLQAIRDAFKALAERVQPGDFVYLHFSGHGSQAPAKDPDSELDGLDELFLPVDIGPWNDSVGEVENALVDDEIGELIGMLRAKGADVWAVFDSCHSGTVTRAAPNGEDDEKMRKLEPGALGVPQAAITDAEGASRGLESPRDRADAPVAEEEERKEGEGTFVAFFAAQTNETTPEKLMPRSTKDRLQGVFTYTLFETLAERPGITYRQLGQEVLRKYSVKNLARSTPLFEGDLDGVVFGSGETVDVRQWPAEKGETKLRLRAGTLHGLASGERLAVLGSPADSTADAIGYATVDSATTFGATAVLEDGKTLDDVPRGAFLRKVDTGVDMTLRVALPEGEGAVHEAMKVAAQAIEGNGQLGGRFSFVAPGEEADIRLAVIAESPRPDAIWILDGTGEVPVADRSEQTPGEAPVLNFSSLPSVSTGDKSADDLAKVLTEQFAHIGKALNVLRIGAASGGNGLSVPVELHRARFDLDAGAIVEGSRAAMDAGNVPRLIPGDTIGVWAQNTTDEPLDINVLYVGADYSITFMDKARMQPGGIYNEDLSLISDEYFGRDRLVVILSPVAEQSDVEDLSFLQQDPLVRTRAIGTGGEGFRGLLDEAGFGQKTRAALPLGGMKKGPEPVILQFEIDTVPGEG